MRPRRLLKIAGIAAGTLVLFLAAVLLGAWGAANTEAGRQWLTRQATAALADAGMEADIQGLQGPLPQRLALDRLVLRDREGVWLTLEDAEVAWRPLALLTGQLAVARVTAARLALPRLPAASEDTAAAPEDDEAPFTVPEPPLSLRLDTLRVDRIDLGAPVLGEAASFRLTGQAAAPAAGTLRSDLEVVRLDGPGGEVTLTAAYAPREQTLDLDLRVVGAAGGLLAGALDLPPDAKVSARLQGTGSLDAWDGTLDARLGPEATIAARLGIEGRRTLTVDGRAEVMSLLPPEVRPLVGGAIDLSLRATSPDFAELRVEKATVRTPTTEVSLSGRLDGGAGTVQAAGEVTLRDPGPVNALIAPARLAGVSATLSARGPLTAPAAKATLHAKEVAAPEATLTDVAAEVDFTPRGEALRGEVKLSVTGERIGLAMPALAGFDGEAVRLDASGELDLDSLRLAGAEARLEIAETTLEVSGDAALAAPRAALDYRLAMDDLARLEPAVGLGLSGRGTLAGDVGYGGEAALVEATVDGDFRELAWRAQDIVNALAGGRLRLGSRITLARDGALTVSDLELASDAARVTGDLAFPADFASLSGDVAAELPRLDMLSQPLDTPLAGAARLDAKLSGPLADPAVRATVTGSDLSAAGTAVSRLTIDATAQQLVSGARGTVDVTAEGTPAGPLTARTDFALGAESVSLSGLRAELEGLRLADGRLDLPLAGGAMDGQARIEGSDLGRLAGRFGVALAGRGEASVALAPGQEGQGVRLDAELRDLALPDSEVSARTVTLSARLDNALAAPRGTVEVALREAAAGPATLATAELAADGDLDAAALSLRAEGEVFGPMTLESRARVQRSGEALTLTLQELVASVQKQRITLTQPATLRRTGETLAVQDLRLESGGGALALDIERTATTIDATLSSESLPLALANLALAEPGLSGTLDSELRLSGPLGAPEGSLRLAASKVAAAESDLPPLDAELEGRLQGGRLAVSGALSGISESPVELSAELPVRLSLAPFAAAVVPDAPLRAAVDWRGPVAPLMPYVPAGGHRLTGQGEVALELGGTLNEPAPRGHITLSGATYENFDSGTLLTELQARIEGDGRTLRLVELSARDGSSKGKVRAEGRLDLAALDNPRLELTLTTRKARLVRRDELRARANTDITVSGPLTDLRVAGTVEVTSAEARVPGSLPPEVAELDVVETDGVQAEAVAEPAEPPPEDAAPAPAARVALDITVTIPNQFFLRGRGLDTEWSGELRVTGTADQPIVTGQLSSVRGQIDVLNKSFRLESGEVVFDGGKKIEPTVDISAVSRTEELTATVRVSGPASQPELSLSSVPALPQDEILARLLFGQGTGELSAVQAAQLAAAVAELSGATGGGPGILDRVRRLAGVDVLQLGGEGEGTSVKAGKYLSEDVFVGVEQGVEEDSSQVSVEVDLTDNIAVESNVGATGQSDVGIQFKWDY